MSVKVMGQVWDIQDLTSSEKLVLLAYADHAHHDGTGIWPAVMTVARKASLSERTVQRVTRELEEKGYLVSDGHHDSGTNLWKIPLDMGGDTMTPPGVTPCQGGVTLTTERGDTMTPKPLINHNNKPSKKKSRKRDPLLDHPAIIAYREEVHLHVPIAWREEVCSTVDDSERWKQLVHDWIGHGWNKQNIKGLLQAYRNGGIRTKKSEPAGFAGIRDYIAEEQEQTQDGN